MGHYCFYLENAVLTGKEMSVIATSPWNWSAQKEPLLDVKGSDPPYSTCQKLTSGLCASLTIAADDLADTYSKPIPSLPCAR